MSRELKFEQYKQIWSEKTVAKVEKELASYRKRMLKHKDGFFHECAPDDLTDGLRIVALKDVLQSLNNQ